MRRTLTIAICLLAAGAAVRACAAATFLPQEAEGEFAVQCILAAGDRQALDRGVRILFNFTDEDHTYVADIRRGRAELTKVRGGKAVRLAGPVALPDSAGPKARVSILRRQWHIALLWDGKTVCRAYDDELQGGKCGYEGDAVEDAFLQPLADIYGNDDFVRESGSAAGWTTVNGQWENCALESDGLKVEWNANPFAFVSRTPRTALARYGNWFWDDYRAGVSAKGPEGGAIGLCVRFQDPDNFVLFRWAASAGAGGGAEKQLIQVTDGEWKTLATSAGGYLPRQWHRLEVAVFGDRVEAYADRQRVMMYEPVAFGAGAVALYASDGDEAYFDDFRVEGLRALTDAFGESGSAVGPKWRPSGVKLTARANGIWLGARGGPGVATGGPTEWGDFRFAAQVRAEDAGGIGIVFARRGPGEGYLLRWGGTSRTQYQGKIQLVRYSSGRPTILAQAPGAHAVKKWQPFELTVRRGYVVARVGDGETLECFDPTLPDGAIALFADRTKGVCFRQIDVRSLEDEVSRPRITEQFTKEATMSGWASPQGAWRRAEVPPDMMLWWNKGSFYADPSVEFALPPVGSANGQIAGIICANGAEPDSGYAVRATLQAGSPKFGLMLFRKRELLARREVESERGATPRVSLAKRGRYVIASVDGRCVAFSRDDFELQGRFVGIACQGVQPDLASAVATTPNMVDYTFSDAPVDWQAARGEWRIMNRWPCKKGWAWYGGVGDKVPVLWSKRSFAGDMTLEFYGAIRMDLPREPGYSHPGDINCAICGDGRRLDSGYAFIYAGWGNRKGAILRKGAVVGQNTSARFENPVSYNIAFQRHWFYVRVEKDGNRIRYSVDDRPVASYEDPDPIPEGRVAFWTWDNGLLIARARISYERTGLAEPVTSRIPPDPTDLPYTLYAQQ